MLTVLARARMVDSSEDMGWAGMEYVNLIWMFTFLASALIIGASERLRFAHRKTYDGCQVGVLWVSFPEPEALKKRALLDQRHMF